MAQCITCGTELHPERAQKYNYCMSPECQEKNAKGLTIVTVGMNKAADEIMVLDEGTREDLASGGVPSAHPPRDPGPLPGPPGPAGARPEAPSRGRKSLHPSPHRPPARG